VVLAMTRPKAHERTGIYQFRKVVPERLRPLVGKREVKISLGTRDPQEAKTRHATTASEVEAEWLRLERIADGLVGEERTKLSLQQIVALAGEIYDGLIAQHGADPGPPSHWKAQLDRIQPALAPPHRAPGAFVMFNAPSYVWINASRLMGDRVNDLLLRHDLAVDFHSRARLLAESAKAAAQAYRELAKRAEGDYTPDPAQQRFPHFAPAARTAPLMWTEVYEKYKSEAKPSPATIKRQLGVLQAFFKFLEHDDLASVNDADAERWVAHRLTMVSDRTVRDADMAHPKTLCLFAKRKKLIARNPFEDVKVIVGKPVKLRDREFTMDEAEAILSAALVPPGPRMTVEGAAARRWIPWVCAYTGARVNEITQVRAEDIKERMSQNRSKVWCIRITPEAGAVKTSTARWVALHPHLIEQGFLAFVQSRAGRHLFYDPTRRRDGTAANPQYKKVGERLAAWVRSDVGITDTGVDPNHGWRHLFRSALLAAGVQEQIIDRIDGHASATTGRTYGTAWPQVMLEAVSKIPPFLEQGETL
jgi:integrase